MLFYVFFGNYTQICSKYTILNSSICIPLAGIFLSFDAPVQASMFVWQSHVKSFLKKIVDVQYYTAKKIVMIFGQIKKKLIYQTILIFGKSCIWFPQSMTQRDQSSVRSIKPIQWLLITDNSDTLRPVPVLFQFGNGSYLGEFDICRIFLCLGR